MGIQNRDYYRERQPVYGITPVIKYLIIANVVVFLLQIFVLREVKTSPLDQLRRWDPALDRLMREKEQEGPEALEKFRKEYEESFYEDERPLDAQLRRKEKVSIVQEWFQLDTQKVLHGQVWRLLTSAFCHDRHAVWHILFNMVVLYWFGCTIESMYGQREFLLFYLTAAMASSLACVGLDLFTGSNVPAIGASGAVMGVTMLYTMHFPYETIRIFWFFPLEMRWLMCLYLIWDLHPVLLALAGDQIYTGVAHAGHLGGLAFGFLYYWYEWRLEPLLDRLPAWHWPSRCRQRPALCVYAEPPREPDLEMNRVDQILRKITESGQVSLTDEEAQLFEKPVPASAIVSPNEVAGSMRIKRRCGVLAG